LNEALGKSRKGVPLVSWGGQHTNQVAYSLHLSSHRGWKSKGKVSAGWGAPEGSEAESPPCLSSHFCWFMAIFGVPWLPDLSPSPLMFTWCSLPVFMSASMSRCPFSIRRCSYWFRIHSNYFTLITFVINHVPSYCIRHSLKDRLWKECPWNAIPTKAIKTQRGK
jgi:hypothetical protein